MSFFSNWSGGDQRRDIRNGLAQGNQHLTQGRDQAQGSYDAAYDDSRGYLDPYAQSGQQGQQYYDDLLGLNGAGSRDDAQNLLMSDQAFKGQLGQAENAMLRVMNSQGRNNSGAGLLAAERVFQQQYGNVLNRYANRAQQGFGAAQASANNANQYGNNSAQLQYGYGQQMAGNAMSAANAVGQTRNTGMNNMLGLVGAGTGAANAFRSRG